MVFFKIFNLFQIQKTYSDWKAKRIVEQNDRVIIVMQNLEFLYIEAPDGSVPDMRDVINTLNEMVRKNTTAVKAEFGF